MHKIWIERPLIRSAVIIKRKTHDLFHTCYRCICGHSLPRSSDSDYNSKNTSSINRNSHSSHNNNNNSSSSSSSSGSEGNTNICVSFWESLSAVNFASFLSFCGGMLLPALWYVYVWILGLYLEL